MRKKAASAEHLSAYQHLSASEQILSAGQCYDLYVQPSEWLYGYSDKADHICMPVYCYSLYDEAVNFPLTKSAFADS